MAKTADLPGVLNPEQRLKLEQVSVLTGTARSKIYADIKAGLFPPPERDGPRFSRWRAGDVLAHLDRKRQVAQEAAQ